MIRSEKPASTANAKAFQHANTSAPSLSATASPFADSAAITSPFSLRTTAPTPDASPFANTATSKLSLEIDMIYEKIQKNVIILNSNLNRIFGQENIEI